MSDSRKFLYAIAKERKFCYVKLFKKKSFWTLMGAMILVVASTALLYTNILRIRSMPKSGKTMTSAVYSK